ncbi:MAG: hypothetical protein HC936_04240 [Leptolyngbyaceae cyanobacterium SU_3_3]|nr:hypothetical protein [Leptolyngbyaceae cyanobacterium SU_3_3]
MITDGSLEGEWEGQVQYHLSVKALALSPHKLKAEGVVKHDLATNLVYASSILAAR